MNGIYLDLDNASTFSKMHKIKKFAVKIIFEKIYKSSYIIRSHIYFLKNTTIILLVISSDLNTQLICYNLS